MPRVPGVAPVRLPVDDATARAAAVARLGAIASEDGALRIPTEGVPSRDMAVVLTFTADGDGTIVSAYRVGWIDIPFFWWFFRPLTLIAGRRACTHALATLRHELGDGPLPAPPADVIGLPNVAFSYEQATLLATAAAAVAVAAFCAALFGQLSDPIGDSFGASDEALTTALAITRVGALVALFSTALADRRGRRRAILIGVVGSASACAASAVAPTLFIFTFAQVFQRSFIITTAVVAGIAAIEEAPEGARAYSASMLALAGGFGFSFSVVTLPLADLGVEAWRLPFVAGAACIFFVPAIARHLAETSRYAALTEQPRIARGRVREILDARYKRRFALLATIGFLTGVFNAPSSQLMNKYLSDVRDFSNSGIALFRTVTTGVPGLIGLVIGGRLAERYGRKPVAIVALLVAFSTQMVFFLYGGSVMWVMSAVSVLTSAAGGIALGTLDAELFPTEVRGTSNAMLVVVGVVGSSLGLVLAGQLSDPLGDIGRSIALLGIPALIAVVFFVPRLPETSGSDLDEVSPSEWPDEYGPEHAGT
jgi:MFS family permease